MVPRAAVGGSRRELRSLTGLRALAAFAVFAFHSAAYGDVATSGWHVADIGFVGVSFFFILSGVVLTWSWSDSVSAVTFAMRRFARIYPAHLVMAAVAIVLYERWQPSLEPVWAVVLSVLLLQAWTLSDTALKAGNGVSWSLSAEFFFYGCFPKLRSWFARLMPRERVRIAVVYGAVVTAVSVMASYGFSGRYDVTVDQFPLVRIEDFVVGVVIGLALREGRFTRWSCRNAWLAVGAASGVGLLLGSYRGWEAPRGTTDVLVLIPFAVLIAAYARRDVANQRSFLARPTLVYLGRISYCFYLVHQVVASCVSHAISWRVSSLGDAASRTTLSLALSLLAAAALHHGVELPMQRRVMRVYRRRHGAAPGTVTQAITTLPAKPETERVA